MSNHTIPRFIPSDPTVGGASRTGIHYMKEWRSCPIKWFNKFARPHPSGGLGLRSKDMTKPLVLGVCVHDGLEAYYHSGIRCGKDSCIRDVELAVRTAQAKLATFDLADFPEIREACFAESEKLIRSYHDFWGPGGINDDTTELRVVCDSSGPIIEREYEIDLGNGYSYTCRVDLVVEQWEQCYVMEHKTCGVYGLWSLVRRFNLDAQATGECLVLSDKLGDKPVNGVMLNALVKERGPNSKVPPFHREPIPRSDLQLEKFEDDARSTLIDIDQHMYLYNELVDKGVSVDSAARKVFPGHGTSNGHCQAWNRPCEYTDLCQHPGYELKYLCNYDPRSRKPNPFHESEVRD